MVDATLSLCVLVATPVTGAMHASPHAEETSTIVGLKLTQISSGLGDEVENGLGGVLFGETTLVHGWLELELSAGFLVLPDEEVVPIEILLKKPFHFGVFCPYFGLGPTADLIRSEGTDVFPGLSAVAGAYIWLTDAVALDIEVTYSAIFEDEGETLHELLFGLGPALRF